MHKQTSCFTQRSVRCESCSLNNICIPNSLSETEIAELEVSVNKNIKVRKKEALYNAMDEVDGIYAIKSGAIKTSISNKNGQEQVLSFHLPGDLLGFDAFNNGIHSCNAVALEDTLLCNISIEIFHDLCGRLSGIRKEMMHQVGKEITHHQNLLLSLGQQKTDKRLATFLLEMSTHFQSRGFSAQEFLMPMSRQDLSNYLGMAVETLSRVITRMTDDGLIKIDRRLVIIPDIDKLKLLTQKSSK